MFMIPLGFILLFLFVIKVVDVKSSDAKLKRKLRARTVKDENNHSVFNSDSRVSQFNKRDFAEFKNMIERSFVANIEKNIKETGERLSSNPQLIGLVILSSINNTYDTLKEGLTNNSEINKVISNKEIMEVIKEIRYKIKNEYLG